ncbi:hypothetical protein [Bradyrhizobium sp. SZCCHNR2026]|uniref:hypothetical protein n=1 Tax=Bradyrhizobium sp. SZCCHNR2026 TaxID=3057381 RepID=UPI002915EC29|nr:hypothetical protein [Bradyrhizobium sp. SZCCHNR2026]
MARMSPRVVPATRPSLEERIDLWFSKGHLVDGIWVGSFRSDAKPAVQRIEDALRLIERNAPLHYRRVKNNLTRIWVNLVPHGAGCYLHSLNACVLDERAVASQTATVEWIASAIVHEATHARLEKLGIRYDEAVRNRIERVCALRELNFARHLSGADALLEEINWRLDQCGGDNVFYTNQNMWEQTVQGNAEILRHLGTPEWVITLVFRAGYLVNGIRRFTRRTAGASVQ